MSDTKKIHVNFNMGDSNVIVKTSSTVKIEETLTVFTEEMPVLLNVTISADFEDIPEKYREIFVNVITARYLGKVSFGDNPFSDCKPLKKRKWWEFWKSEYFTQ